MPLWRMGPSPKGPYWEEGMKLGYQDVGSWTLFKSTDVERRKAAWLYAQFAVSKTVSLKKADVGLTFVRKSTVNHDHFTKRAPELGGLVECYRSDNRNVWQNGLPRSHAQTMVSTSRSRKQLQKGIVLNKRDGKPLNHS